MNLYFLFAITPQFMFLSVEANIPNVHIYFMHNPNKFYVFVLFLCILIREE